MAHSAPPSRPPRRRLEIIIGVVLLVVAIPVIVVAVIALRHPNGHQAGKVSGSVINTVTPSASPTKTTPAPTTSATSLAPTSPATTPATSTSAPATSASITAAREPLIVLNNTSTTGLAATAAARFKAGGWTVTDISSFEGGIASTAAYYDPSVTGAQAAATALQKQFPAIKRVKEKFDGLPSGPVVVVVTTDYNQSDN